MNVGLENLKPSTARTRACWCKTTNRRVKKEKTASSLGEWIALPKKEVTMTIKERREWLKIQRQLGMNRVSWVAQPHGGEDSPKKYQAAAPKYVDRQFSDKKDNSGRPLKRPCRWRRSLVLTSKALAKPSFRYIKIAFRAARCKSKLQKRLVDNGGLAKERQDYTAA